ncbi:Cell division protein FtsL [Clostridiales bacterium CHKCI006]|nr:Cell division protein FtsL [Clostridiales bacterium CHKCI006]
MAKQRRKFKKSRLIGFACVILSCVMLYSMGQRVYHYYLDSKQLAELEAQKVTLEEERQKLEEQLDLLDDENYVTRYARKYWVFTKEGEKVITLPDDNTQQ